MQALAGNNLAEWRVQSSPSRRRLILLVLLIVVAATFRFAFLDRHDIIDDEASYALRGIGYFDYDSNDAARGPTQIFPVQQWWQPLSFTDHPPMVFFVTHLFYVLFGVNAFVARLPFALAGVASVFLVYVIGRKLLGERFGLLAAAILAVDNFHLWFSRIGFTESLQIFFILLTVLALIKAVHDERHTASLGAAAGLLVLTKYTALFLFPLLFLVLLRFNPRALWTRWTAIGVLIFILLVSPIVIYNVMLFSTRGHFDFALSIILGIQGEDFASNDLVRSFNPFGWAQLFWRGHGPIMSALAVVGVLVALRRWRRGWTGADLTVAIILSYFFFFGVAVALGFTPKKEYGGVVVPLITLSAAYALFYIMRVLPERLGGAVTSIALAALAFISVNSQLLIHPRGWQYLTYLPQRPMSYAYRPLDQYLHKLYSDSVRSAYFPSYRHPQVVAYQESRIRDIQERSQREKVRRYDPVVFLDERMDFFVLRWIQHRRALYDVQPIFLMKTSLGSAGQLNDMRQVFNLARFQEALFVFTEPALRASGVGYAFGEDGATATRVRAQLERSGYRPMAQIKDPDGRVVFTVYRTTELGFLSV